MRKSRATRAEGSTAWMIGIPVAFMLLLFFYPLVEVIKLSVSEPTLGLQNYRQVFTSEAVLHVAAVTVRVCAVTTIATLVLAYVLAYLIVHSSETAKKVLIVCVLIPMWVSVLVRAFAWVVLLRREGVVNSLLLSAGVIDSPLPLVWNEFGVVLSMTHYMLPYAVLPLYTAMSSVDQRLVAAARGMGASKAQAFLRVFLPLTKAGIIGAGTLVFIFSLGFYVTPAIMGGGRVLMVAEYTSVQILEVLNWGGGTTISIVMIVAICLLLGVIEKVAGLRELIGVKETR
jgi:putative spermidine/putrescine transport system permease protein